MMKRRIDWRIPLGLVLAGLLAGCATNPVTGKNELALVSESSELEIGREQYQPSRQIQGGDYVLEPALTGYVQAVGAKLARASDRQLPYEFSIVNDSSPNAWALPGGKIAINRGLLVELRNEAELAAVLGHEIVHAAARHSAQGIERGILLQGALIAAGVATSGSDYQQLALGAAAIGGQLVNQRYSREAELESDSYGMEYMARAGYDPRAAIRLQETFVRLSEGKQQNWLAGLFASHPPSPERVAANRKKAEGMAKGGYIGQREYQQKIAGLHRTKEAYAAYDDGREVLDKEPQKALRLADKAIAVEPREALFHGLRGDALNKQKKYQQARRAYDQAVACNENYFLPLLRRGQVRARLGDDSGARRDLQRSLELLPTADAHYYLGQVLLQEGERRQAVKHFQVAAQSKSSLGGAASRELEKLGAGRSPASRLQARLGRDASGQLLLELSNPTNTEFTDLVLLVGKKDAAGRIYRGRKFELDGRLRPGRKLRARLPASGITSKQLERLAVRVLSARTVGR